MSYVYLLYLNKHLAAYLAFLYLLDSSNTLPAKCGN